MQCVILAAGKGTRMLPLTKTIPKPLIKVCGKPILDHIVEALPANITELVIVTNYLEEQIRAHCGEEFYGRKVTYVHQDNPAGGTGNALLCTKNLLTGKFIVLNGDDIHGAEALVEAVQEPYSILAVYSETPELFGVLEKNEDGTLKAIVEKPKEPTSNLVNTGGFVTDLALFENDVAVSDAGELYATDMLTQCASFKKVKIIEQKKWLPIGYPEDIKKAEYILEKFGGKLA
ncbi:NTP transferase domain-containing protein [Candidatus Nomurabacteria bacterium]|nr:NTP transferase domain-containing protein [Candidatus Kaiserbacteria bacterium]MCB9815379.1 NTP transferase domain-containing protein [Candidatus Nomurabacteria bacterium]